MNYRLPLPQAAAAYNQLALQLASSRKNWLITGVAGFIGSHLLEALLQLGQNVTGLDNLATGSVRNLEEARSHCNEEDWKRFRFIEGSICDLNTCKEACRGVNYVLHQAALGSVPRSIENPSATHLANVDGTFNIFLAAKEARVPRVVYASSSSVYGDHPALPKIESAIGRPLSPYAASKRIGEVYAESFGSTFGLETLGLRYFNVFGPRQDPNGPYAAVIPLWISRFLKGDSISIYGDGSTSRDFCYVRNVVQANLLAATRSDKALGEVYNVACGERTTLNDLFSILKDLLGPKNERIARMKPHYQDFRPGDIKHSLANIDKARKHLGYFPTHSLRSGLEESLDWYRNNCFKSIDSNLLKES